ncbi:hypothetical protein LTR78_005868 [Recurvomyces mirabilis]|uniref:Uncharacterized protein n=1 Tax=Recurvomyces mirabilis TaxID=574656 RepID=A0AAE0WMF3_9PEZI|nr:hypothetical protein LTR78_005868 [Recurvomyces mirabilis]KAK5154249.1 hypothetical protein LTS14_006934 [Recurvomyces mirabilis]
MAPVFASADMAALVAAYRPITPIRDRPSLVPGRRTSDEHLIDSRNILKRFSSLLQSRPSRIALSELQSLLNIDSTDWLLACYEQPLYYSHDGRQILSIPEVAEILDDAFGHAGVKSFDAASFATKHDLSRSTLHLLLESSPDSKKLHWWEDPSTKSSHVYSTVLWQAVLKYLELVAKSSYAKSEFAEGLDLCSHFPSVPGGLLLGLAQAFAAKTSDSSPAGEWQLLKGRAVFIPASHVHDLESKKEAARRAHVEQCVEGISTRGFCKVDELDLLSQIRQQYIARYPEHNVEDGLIEVTPDGDVGPSVHTYMARPSYLHEAMQSLHIAAPQESARIWHARDGSENNIKLIAAVFKSLIDETHRELQRAMLQSQPYRSEVEKTIVTALERQGAQDAVAFEKIILERLVNPVQLYTLGVANTRDDTLVQHLNEFLCDYSRRDVLPTIISTLQEDRLILDKSRKKDFEKMAEAISQAKILPDVQAAITKLARKQKLIQPSEIELVSAKRTTLEQKARQLRNKKIVRGSDVLQNCIWISLAEKTDGLYMSSGKDTTRMIKLYSTIAGADGEDGGIAEKLSGCRDALKAGKEDQQMLDIMRDLAVERAEAWCAAHATGPSTEEPTRQSDT